ncbi:RbsD/FucU domain-containing protein [Raineyella sp.]|uniref:RbsD/FucU domain-containing protein n=1 Tax=Raineyella sp. TaxID=1911550 RepID=UPI002B20B1D0|nr:RbsD/FucU domain-containing protein [Raineyella sp.]MEA5155033.1 RbsD/FucU domain-containing protein [Raineyella sp.]
MLKGLDPLLVPELLLALAQMGHGDVVAVVDRNFPAHSVARRTVELPGSTAEQVVRAVCSVLPVDTFGTPAVVHMLTAQGEESPATPACRTAWRSAQAGPVAESGAGRTEFYESARRAYLTVRTGETLPYACYLVTKGVVTA